MYKAWQQLELVGNQDSIANSLSIHPLTKYSARVEIFPAGGFFRMWFLTRPQYEYFSWKTLSHETPFTATVSLVKLYFDYSQNKNLDFLQKGGLMFTISPMKQSKLCSTPHFNHWFYIVSEFYLSEANFSFLFNQLVPYIPSCLIASQQDILFSQKSCKGRTVIIKGLSIKREELQNPRKGAISITGAP